jgi:NAD-dependent DNA ligase
MAITKEQLDAYIKADAEGHPLIPDEEYDMLLEEYLKEHGEDKRPFNRQKQSSSVNDIVGTLPKAYGVIEPWREGLLTYKEWTRKNNLTDKDTIQIQPKYDGCSVAFDVKTQKFFTRGDVDDGTSMDVTDLFKDRVDWIMNEILWGYDEAVSIKFEAIMSHEAYMSSGMNQRYLRPRDAVSANMTLRDPNIAKLTSLIPLRAYMNGKQFLPRALPSYVGRIRSGWTNALNFESIQVTIDELLSNSATDKVDYVGLEGTYSVDGVVVSVFEDGVFGENNVTYPLYVKPGVEVAIKILKDIKETTLKTVEFQFGKQGRITPVAILDPPAKFGNITVDHVTLSTLKRVQEMGLRVHDTVRIMYNIVPYFIDSYHDGDYPILLPQKCPICGEALDYLGSTIVRCQNPNCKGLKLGAIIRHAEKMRMVGIGEGVITKLYDNEFITCISDLYDLRKWDDCIAQTPGFGYTSFDNMVNSIDKALSEASLERFLGALPFNDTDEKTWRAIIDVVGRDNLITAMRNGSLEFFLMNSTYIPNVGQAKIQRIIDGYLRNAAEIQELMTWVPEKLRPDLPKHITRKGRVCFTGFRDKELENQLIENGWDIGGLTKDTKVLIVPTYDYTSEKVKKAKEFGIEVIERDRVPYTLFQPF